jgi:DNA invertase Pin-like site-specific DNA recombinase
MSTEATTHPKINAEYLTRKAIVYVRQSTTMQVRHNLESQSLQYALKQQAERLGFAQIDVIDTDLGVSASSASRPREGFKQLLADVALGQVGLILSREVSRLSRSDKDWCHLIELCRIYDTLLGDAEQIYNPNLMDDQLILGIKGTLSVVELGVLKLRMQQGKEAKAKRGELYGSQIAPGYQVDVEGNLVKDPNRRVQEIIELIFKMFRKLGSARKTHRWFIDNQVEVPVNKVVAGHFQLIWQQPSQGYLRDVINNPFYAGAYYHGRRPREIVMRDGMPHRRQANYLDPDKIKVFIHEHHEGYISWETYEENRAMMKENSGNFNPDGDASVSAAREGQALLTGLLRCARCGRKLQVRYWGSKGKVARYFCHGTYQQGGEYCIRFGSLKVDERFEEEVLAIISPLGIEASLRASEQLAQKNNERSEALLRKCEQLDYEAQRAFEQYDRVDPANRLVAETLEKRWNEKLKRLEYTRNELGREQSQAKSITDQDKEDVLALGKDFARVWRDPACPMSLKKRLVRLLIHEIVADIDEQSQQLRFIIHWQGGCHSELMLERPRSAAQAHKTDTKDLEIIRAMAPKYDDMAIARVLASLGRTTGKGNKWNRRSVAYIRRHYGLGAYDPKALAGTTSLVQAAKQCGISDGSIKRLIDAKILPATQVAPYAPIEIKLKDLDSEIVQQHIQTLKRTGKLSIEGTIMDNQQSLF